MPLVSTAITLIKFSIPEVNLFIASSLAPAPPVGGWVVGWAVVGCAVGGWDVGASVGNSESLSKPKKPRVLSNIEGSEGSDGSEGAAVGSEGASVGSEGTVREGDLIEISGVITILSGSILIWEKSSKILLYFSVSLVLFKPLTLLTPLAFKILDLFLFVVLLKNSKRVLFSIEFLSSFAIFNLSTFISPLDKASQKSLSTSVEVGNLTPIVCFILLRL